MQGGLKKVTSRSTFASLKAEIIQGGCHFATSPGLDHLAPISDRMMASRKPLNAKSHKKSQQKPTGEFSYGEISCETRGWGGLQREKERKKGGREKRRIWKVCRSNEHLNV